MVGTQKNIKKNFKNISAFRPCQRAKVSKNTIFLIKIHSFIPAFSIAPLQVLYHSEALPTTARILYQSFTPKRTGNGLAQGPYVMARAGVEPTTLRLKVIDSTKVPSRPTKMMVFLLQLFICNYQTPLQHTVGKSSFILRKWHIICQYIFIFGKVIKF